MTCDSQGTGLADLSQMHHRFAKRRTRKALQVLEGTIDTWTPNPQVPGHTTNCPRARVSATQCRTPQGWHRAQRGPDAAVTRPCRTIREDPAVAEHAA